MKQEVRNVGKFSASTPSSGSNYLLYSSVESINFLFHLSLSLTTGYYPTISISIMRLINSELLRHLIITGHVRLCPLVS